ncbi:dihydroxy-acid dehydratase domain-containing protein, partial [Acinetobacter baumannii]|uniref:dihydroxy-acid dehydratase domain-containing protein n=1 Tax=Acinetobacter baumannii TaxID=470 RepID=UPI0034618B4A
PVRIVGSVRCVKDRRLEDSQGVGENIALIVNCMPAGNYLGEGFHRAGGVPAVLHELEKGAVL